LGHALGSDSQPSKQFHELLDWHLINGTRPPGLRKGEWSSKEFAGAVKPGLTDKAVRNWRAGRNLPRVITQIERALFGDAPTGQNAEWREELRSAHDAASAPDSMVTSGLPKFEQENIKLERIDGRELILMITEGRTFGVVEVNSRDVPHGAVQDLFVAIQTRVLEVMDVFDVASQAELLGCYGDMLDGLISDLDAEGHCLYAAQRRFTYLAVIPKGITRVYVKLQPTRREQIRT
jgi:hypothetical protein